MRHRSALSPFLPGFYRHAEVACERVDQFDLFHAIKGRDKSSPSSRTFWGVIFGDNLSDHLGMAKTDSDLRGRYIKRVKELREKRGITQQEMADLLGIPLERYKKYEQRSALPAWHLDRFAAIVGKDIGFVITGRATRSRKKSAPEDGTPGATC